MDNNILFLSPLRHEAINGLNVSFMCADSIKDLPHRLSLATPMNVEPYSRATKPKDIAHKV